MEFTINQNAFQTFFFDKIGNQGTLTNLFFYQKCGTYYLMVSYSISTILCCLSSMKNDSRNTQSYKLSVNYFQRVKLDKFGLYIINEKVYCYILSPYIHDITLSTLKHLFAKKLAHKKISLSVVDLFLTSFHFFQNASCYIKSQRRRLHPIAGQIYIHGYQQHLLPK